MSKDFKHYKYLTKYKTDYLFARPSFLLGIGSLLNIAGNYYNFNYSESDIESDIKAMENDWGIIGGDIMRSISHFHNTAVV